MPFRRLLAPAVWLTATVTAAVLVSFAVAMAVRSVSPPAAAARLQSGRQQVVVGGLPTGTGAVSGGSAGAGPVGSGPRLPVVAGSVDHPATPRPDTAAGGSGPALLTASGPASQTPPSSAGGPAPSTTTTTARPAAQPSTASSTTTTSSSTTTTTAPSGSSTPSSTTTSSTTSSTTSTTAPTEVFWSTGGSVGMHCDGDSAVFEFASPNDGYQYDLVDRGPDAVDVTFTRSRHTSEIRVTCSGGQATAQIT